MQNRIRVLIADDNKEFCDIVRRYLEKQDDMEVIGIAGDGIEALEMIINIQPEVVILDIIMPHIDGLGVLERLNNSNLENKSKIIILSAVGQDKITQRAIALGADYYFVKPFDMEIFVKRIRELAMGITQIEMYRFLQLTSQPRLLLLLLSLKPVITIILPLKRI